MTEVAVEDRNRLRATPAYRRAVRGLQAVSLAVLLVPVIFLAAIGFSEAVGAALFTVVFLLVLVGVVLGWSSMLPLERARRAILAKYRLDPFEQTLLMNGMLFRDVVRLRRRSPSEGAAG